MSSPRALHFSTLIKYKIIAAALSMCNRNSCLVMLDVITRREQ